MKALQACSRYIVLYCLIDFYSIESFTKINITDHTAGGEITYNLENSIFCVFTSSQHVGPPTSGFNFVQSLSENFRKQLLFKKILVTKKREKKL